MNNIYLEHLSADERDNLIEESILDNEYRRAEMMYNIVEMQEEQMMREAELKVLAESGTYDDLVLLYEEVQAETAEKKKGILESIFAWFAKVFSSISSFFADIRKSITDDNKNETVEIDSNENTVLDNAQEAYNIANELLSEVEKLNDNDPSAVAGLMSKTNKLSGLFKNNKGKIAAGAAAGTATAVGVVAVKKSHILDKCNILESLTNLLNKITKKIEAIWKKATGAIAGQAQKISQKKEERAKRKEQKKNGGQQPQQTGTNTQPTQTSEPQQPTQATPQQTGANTQPTQTGGPQQPKTESVDDFMYLESDEQQPSTQSTNNGNQNSNDKQNQTSSNSTAGSEENKGTSDTNAFVNIIKGIVNWIRKFISKLKEKLTGNKNNTESNDGEAPSNGNNTSDTNGNTDTKKDTVDDRTDAADKDPNPKQKSRTRKEYNKNDKPVEIVNDGGVERSRLAAIKPDGEHGQNLGSGYDPITWFALRTNGQLYYFDKKENKFKIAPENGITVWNQDKSQSKVVKPSKEILDYVNQNILNKKSKVVGESADDDMINASLVLGESCKVYPKTIKNLDFICIEQAIPDDNLNRYKSIFGVDYTGEVQESMTDNDSKLLAELLDNL